MSNKQGPKLTIIYSCEGCDFYEYKNNHPYNYYICNKLGKKLSNIYPPVPDEKCPFKIINTSQFCEETVKNIKEQENTRIRNIINGIFPDIFDFEILNNNVVFNIHSSIAANDIKKLNLEFPNLNWNISASYNREFLKFSATI